MSMFDDVLGLGRSSVTESMTDETFEPEIEGMTLEEAEMLDESTDPMDFILQIAYENEMNMMKLDAAIVAEEYMYLRENGEEMVTEAGKIESVVNKFKQGVQWLWGKIQSFFKTVMNKLDAALKLDQRFLDKYEKKAAGKTGKAKGDEYLFNVGEISSSGVRVLDDLAKAGDVVKKLIDADQEVDFKQTMKSIRLDVMMTGDENVSEKDMLKAMVKGYKEGREVAAFSADKAITAFKASKDAKASLKKAYNSNKKGINAQLKAAKTMESKAKKLKVIPTETSKSIHQGVKVLNKIGTIMTMTNRTYVKLINMSRSFCKAVIVAAAAKDVKAPSATGESASLIDGIEFGMTM